MRPMEVSITTNGPLGTVVAAGVACGASGKSCGCDDCGACAGPAANRRAAGAKRMSGNLFLMPTLRVNHVAGAGKGSGVGESAFVLSQVPESGPGAPASQRAGRSASQQLTAF